jgi:hypothetical protein
MNPIYAVLVTNRMQSVYLSGLSIHHLCDDFSRFCTNSTISSILLETGPVH